MDPRPPTNLAQDTYVSCGKDLFNNKEAFLENQKTKKIVQKQSEFKVALQDAPFVFSKKNKILSDIFIRSNQFLWNPAWGSSLSRLQVERHCTDNWSRETTATTCVDYQAQQSHILTTELENLGVCSATRSPSYKGIDSADYYLHVLDLFSRLITKEIVYQTRKPLPWCSQCRRAVNANEQIPAKTEDLSCYLVFPPAIETRDVVHLRLSEFLLDYQKRKLAKQHNSQNDTENCGELLSQNDEDLSQPSKQHQQQTPLSSTASVEGFAGVLVWTSSPWSLVSSEGVLVNPDSKYLLVRLTLSDTTTFLVSKTMFKARPPAFFAQLRTSSDPASCVVDVLASLSGAQLVDELGGRIGNPLLPDSAAHRPLVLLASPTVKDGMGTGAVHIVPGCSEADYEFGKQNNLPIYSPVLPDGNVQVTPEDEELFSDLCGFPVKETSDLVIERLKTMSRLVAVEEVAHKQDHCNDCGTRLYYRLCDTWLCKMTESSTWAGESDLNYLPKRDKKCFASHMSSSKGGTSLDRSISFYSPSSYGVWFPSMRCRCCNHSRTTPEIVQFLITYLRSHSLPLSPAVPPVHLLFPSCSVSCPSCKQQEIGGWEWEGLVFDQWFEASLASLASPVTGLIASGERYPSGINEKLFSEEARRMSWVQGLFLLAPLLEKEGEPDTKEKSACPARSRPPVKPAPIQPATEEQTGATDNPIERRHRQPRPPRQTPSRPSKQEEPGQPPQLQQPQQPQQQEPTLNKNQPGQDRSTRPSQQARQPRQPKEGQHQKETDNKTRTNKATTERPGRKKKATVKTNILSHNYSSQFCKASNTDVREESDVLRLSLVYGLLKERSSLSPSAILEKEAEDYSKAQETYRNFQMTLAQLSSFLRAPLDESLAHATGAASHSPVTQYVLSALHKTSVKVRRAYETFDLEEALSGLKEFSSSCNGLYLPLLFAQLPSNSSAGCKDDDHVVLRVIGETFRRLLSPLAPFLCEQRVEASDTLPRSLPPQSLCFLDTSDDHLSSSARKDWLSLFKAKEFISPDLMKRSKSKTEEGEKNALIIQFYKGNCGDVSAVQQFLFELASKLPHLFSLENDPPSEDTATVTFSGIFLDLFFGVTSCTASFSPSPTTNQRSFKQSVFVLPVQ